MKSMLKILGAVALIMAFMAGCRSAAVYNVKSNPVKSEKKLTQKEMYKAIYMAGATLGWNITEVKPGLAQGKLNLRDHMALVDIEYDTESYSITYNNSLNLNYDKNKGVIHSNYNGWIQNLERGIETQLKLLSM